MANRNHHQPPMGHRALLPAPNPRNTSDGFHQGGSVDGVDGSDGMLSKASGKSMKRAKVTAVACQPCQKRKSKCDGQRPICSACNTKRTDGECLYDSAGDQRRTASLKERIDAGEREILDLRTIIQTMCADPTTVDMIRERLVANNFRPTRELAQAFRARTRTAGAGSSHDLKNTMNIGTTGTGFRGYPAFNAPSYNHPGSFHDEAAPSPTATAQSGWSSEVVSGEEREEDFGFNQDYHSDAPPWP